MPNNYIAVAGYGMNPYDPRRDPRDATFDGRPAMNTGGSSSGIGTAANFWAGNVGTETSGSILSPANQNMLAAIMRLEPRHQYVLFSNREMDDGWKPLGSETVQVKPGFRVRAVWMQALLPGTLRRMKPAAASQIYWS